MRMGIERFERLPIMGIIREIDAADIGPLMETVCDAGLETIEVAMNTSDAASVLAGVREASAGRMAVGAGTVLSTEELFRALDAGAEFIVLPVLVKDVVRTCCARNVPVFPGAFTPQEAYNAWEAGASMVKVFPSSVAGPDYFKALRGPFRDIKLMAVGGVKLENIHDYFASGANAVAFGAGVFRKEWLERKDFTSIGELVSNYVRVVKEILSEKNSREQ